MARKKTIPYQISPYVWGYLLQLRESGVPIDAAYVFGSWIKGTQHSYSDIDVCVVSPKFTSWSKTNKLLQKVRDDDFLTIEAHGFHPKDFKSNTDPLAWEIRKTGVRVI